MRIDFISVFNPKKSNQSILNNPAMFSTIWSEPLTLWSCFSPLHLGRVSEHWTLLTSGPPPFHFNSWLNHLISSTVGDKNMLNDNAVSYIVLFLRTTPTAQFLSFDLGFPYPLKLSVSISLLCLNCVSIVFGMQTVESTHHSVSLTTSMSYFWGADTSVSNPKCHFGWCVLLWLVEKSCFMVTSWTTASDSMPVWRGELRS